MPSSSSLSCERRSSPSVYSPASSSESKVTADVKCLLPSAETSSFSGSSSPLVSFDSCHASTRLHMKMTVPRMHVRCGSPARSRSPIGRRAHGVATTVVYALPNR